LDNYMIYILRLVAEQTENVSIVAFLATTLIGVLAVNLVWLIMERKMGKTVPVWKKRVIVALIFFVSITYHITFESREAGARTGIVTELDFGNWKGSFLQKQQAVYAGLNVLLFVPFGFLSGMLKKECFWVRRVVICTLYSFLGSFCIECVQLVSGRGYFELTDIVTNTLGGVCGVIFACAIYALKGAKRLEEGC